MAASAIVELRHTFEWGKYVQVVRLPCMSIMELPDKTLQVNTYRPGFFAVAKASLRGCRLAPGAFQDSTRVPAVYFVGLLRINETGN